MTITEIYAPTPPIVLMGCLDSIDFSSGMTDGGWDIALTLMATLLLRRLRFLRFCLSFLSFCLSCRGTAGSIECGARLAGLVDIFLRRGFGTRDALQFAV